MGILGQIGATVGVGGANVRVQLGDTRFAQGDAIQGTLTIVGGNTQQTVNTLKVMLVEEWDEYVTEHQTVHEYDDDDDDGPDIHHRSRRRKVVKREVEDQKVLAMNLQVGPGFQQSYPFEVEVPSAAELSSQEQRWKVVGQGEISMSSDAMHAERIEVGPSRDIIALMRSLEQYGFTTKRPTSTREGLVSVTFTPTGELTKEIDEIVLTLRPSQGPLAGVMAINLQEKGITDYLKAAVGKDIKRTNVTFDRAQLLPDGYTPNAQYVWSVVYQGLVANGVKV